MAETDHLKKIMWFEKFTYQLIKDIDHSAFHKKREEKLKKYRSVNSALIRIFAYRLTYRNFGMLKITLSQLAEEIASDEVKKILIQLEAEDEKKEPQEEDRASELIRIIIFLLREEIEKCLDQVGDIETYLKESPLTGNRAEKKQAVSQTQKSEIKEKEPQKEEKPDHKWMTSSSGGSLIFKEKIPLETPKPEEKFKGETPTRKPKDEDEKTDRKWLTSSSGGSLLFKGKTLEDFSKNLSDYQKKSPAVKGEDHKISLQTAAKKPGDKKRPHPLPDKPKPEPRSKEGKKKTVSSPARTVDDLLKNLGGSELDELIYGTKGRKKNKTSGEVVDREQDDAFMDWID